MIISTFYYHLAFSLDQGQSALVLDDFLNTLTQFWWISGMAALTIVLTFFGRQSSSYFFMATGVLIFAHLFFLFYQSFDKMILFLSVFYLLLNYYLYQVLKIEFSEAYFWPGYHFREIGNKELYKLKATIYTVGSSEQEKREAYLTNWDEHSIFITCKDKNPLKGHVKIELEGWGSQFSCDGVVVTTYPNGYGIKLKDRQKKTALTPGWEEYYNIINSRGYRPLTELTSHRDQV